MCSTARCCAYVSGTTEQRRCGSAGRPVARQNPLCVSAGRMSSIVTFAVHVRPTSRLSTKFNIRKSFTQRQVPIPWRQQKRALFTKREGKSYIAFRKVHQTLMGFSQTPDRIWIVHYHNQTSVSPSLEWPSLTSLLSCDESSSLTVTVKGISSLDTVTSSFISLSLALWGDMSDLSNLARFGLIGILVLGGTLAGWCGCGAAFGPADAHVATVVPVNSGGALGDLGTLCTWGLLVDPDGHTLYGLGEGAGESSMPLVAKRCAIISSLGSEELFFFGVFSRELLASRLPLLPLSLLPLPLLSDLLSTRASVALSSLSSLMVFLHQWQNMTQIREPSIREHVGQIMACSTGIPGVIILVTAPHWMSHGS